MKQFKFPGWLLLVVTVSGILVSQAVLAERSPLKKSDIAEEKILRVGIRKDAKPFSYPHEYLTTVEILPGYKGFMVDVCRRVLRRMKMNDQYFNLKVQAVTVDAKNRFDKLESGEVDMLCGPDSLNIDRLERYNVSHPVFLSGMTYGYLKPTSSLFPRSEYCGNIIGFVNNTTAETSGIDRLSREDILIRFDDAVDFNLKLDARRFEMLNKLVAAKKTELASYHMVLSDVLADITNDLNRRHYFQELKKQNPDAEKHLRCNFNDEYREQYVREKAEGFRHDPDVNYRVQKVIARDITTSECPNGFTQGLPIRKFESHDEGIREFCEGKVLYYLGDYDILHAKAAEQINCDVVFNRFTANKEVYGVFFRSSDVTATEEHPIPDCSPNLQNNSAFTTKEQSATLYADFNQTLLRMMQADIDILGHVYQSEFEGEPMSTDLETFFNGFRIAADLGPTSQ